MQSSNTDAAIVSVIADYFTALHDCDAEAFNRMWHPKGVLLGVGPDGTVVSRDAATFCAGVVKRGASSEYRTHDKILSLERIDHTCASAKVSIALPAAPDSPTPTQTATVYTDFLTLLCDPALGWRVIAKVYSANPLVASPADEGVAPILPADFAAAAAACWDGYVAAGRACDAAAMARVFHPACNLTFATPDALCLVPADAFCERVATRWAMPIHAPYAHLQADPRAASADSLVSLDFAGPGYRPPPARARRALSLAWRVVARAHVHAHLRARRAFRHPLSRLCLSALWWRRVCRAVLRVAYPPFLYTDVLLLYRLGSGEWWIVAKSSGNVPFLKDEAQAPAVA